VLIGKQKKGRGDDALALFVCFRADVEIRALLLYWGNILVPGGVLYASWGYATKKGLVKDDIAAEVPAAICRRILFAQTLYAFGALLCAFNTHWSIAFIVLVQLSYAVGIGRRK
jgi:uncharacterized membrane protein